MSPCSRLYIFNFNCSCFLAGAYASFWGGRSASKSIWKCRQIIISKLMKIEQAGEQGRVMAGEKRESGQSQWSVQNCWQFVVEQIASWSLCWRLICKWPRVCCWPLPEWLGIKLVTLFILPAHPVAPTSHNPHFWAEGKALWADSAQKD